MRGQKQMRKMKADSVPSGVVLLYALSFLVACSGTDKDLGRATDSMESSNSNTVQIPGAPWPEQMIRPELKTWGDAANFDSETIKQLMRQGNAGDARSAVLVAAFFSASTPPDASEIDRWNLIAAENGDIPSAVEVAWTMQQQGGEASCLRAKFWLERAALSGGAYRSRNAAGMSAAEELGLFALRDNWKACIEGNAASYLGSHHQGR